jgi:hypothetical protein
MAATSELKTKNVFGEDSQSGKPEKDLHHFAESGFWLSPCHVSVLLNAARHSCLRATIGSTLVARRAGI